MVVRMALRRRLSLGLLLAVPFLAAASQAPAPPTAAGDPFASFRPWLDITADDRAHADRGETVARILPGRGQEVAVLGLSRIDVEPEAFVARIENIEALRTNPPRTPLTKEMSQPPVPGDLAALRLDPEEVTALRTCHPGDCRLKLTEPEMARLRKVAVANAAGSDAPVHQAFRDLMFERITRYRSGGLAALPAYVDKSEGVKTTDVLNRLIERSPYLTVRQPRLAEFIRQFPRASLPEGEGFLYWALDRVEERPIVSATHVAIVRESPASGLPLVTVAGTQLFATHYYYASLGLTYLVGAQERRYLVYVNRTELDVLGGFFGSLKRAILESRLKRDVTRLITGLRGRLEGQKME
jgi:hypothetical protein